MTLLDTSSLREQAARSIRASIVAGEVHTGRIYPVRHFAEQLGVSATPVREALIDLANDGLVELVRNRGFRIPLLTDGDLDELLELRLMLEVPAMERAASLLSARDDAKCRRYAKKITERALVGDLKGYLEYDRIFHLEVLGTLGNSRLVAVVRRLRDETRLYGLRGLALTGQLWESAREHELLLDALAKGDGVQAGILMRRHLQHTRGIWAGRPEEPAELVLATAPPERHQT